MKLGVFGGTFNPIHWGHLLLAETARDALRLDRVLFIPTNQPPHKPATTLLPGRLRLKLIQLAIRDHAAFVTSALELERPGPSYSVETVRTLRQQLPDAKLFLLMGEDMLAVRWVGWNQLKRWCTIAVARRAGARTGRRERGLVWFAMPQVEIASSAIRARLRAGRSIRYLVAPAVERYIQQHRLYRKESNQ